jgi:hypothetical protein
VICRRQFVVGTTAALLATKSACGQKSQQDGSTLTVVLSFSYREGHVHIKIKVNEQPADIIVDSGATVSLFSLRFRRPEAIQPIFIHTLAGEFPGYAGEAHCEFSRSLKLRLPATFGAFSSGADGLIGSDVLRRFASVTFDFVHSELVLRTNDGAQT